MQIRLKFVLAIGIVLSSRVPLEAENWPQWRGPRNDGTSTEQNLPTMWSKTDHVAWRVPLPGPAGASPIVWEDRIYLTSVEGSDLVLLCFGTDGNLRWKQVVAGGNRSLRGDEGNLASPSPCTDGKLVWTFMGEGTLACYDRDGRQVWKLDLQDRYGKFDIQFGMSSTPVLENGRLYLQLMHSAGAFVIALDAATGKEIWKHVRKSDARDECEHSYASPFMFQDERHHFLLSHGADYIIAHDLKDGAEIFRCGGLNPPDNYNTTLRLVASPVGAPGLIVVPSAKGGPVLGLSPDAHGDITHKAEGHVWSRPRDTPDVPSPVIHEGLVYLCRENGVLICLDSKTGEEIYQKSGHRDRHRASPVYAAGHIYCTARDGTITVVKAGREFEVVASNQLGESTSASPAISNGRLYIRTFDALWAIGPK